MALVDPVTKVWLKGQAYYAAAANGSLAGGLLGMALAQEIISPLALRANAATEATRQLAFLGGPLARDVAIVPGARRDLIGKPITLKGDFLEYGAGQAAFVVGVKELEDSTTELTVLRKLV